MFPQLPKKIESLRTDLSFSTETKISSSVINVYPMADMPAYLLDSVEDVFWSVDT